MLSTHLRDGTGISYTSAKDLGINWYGSGTPNWMNIKWSVLFKFVFFLLVNKGKWDEILINHWVGLNKIDPGDTNVNNFLVYEGFKR